MNRVITGKREQAIAAAQSIEALCRLAGIDPGALATISAGKVRFQARTLLSRGRTDEYHR